MSKKITTLATHRKRILNSKLTKMKKIFAAKVMALVAIATVLASCGSGRHKCPAYGSLDVDQNNIEIAEAK